jgi:hypothetical protein
MLVTREHARHFLGASGIGVPSSTAEDEQLDTIIGAATPVIEELIGPVLQRPVEERVELSGGWMLLRKYPVVELTSVLSSNGTVLPLTDYPAFRASAGIFEAPAGSTDRVTVAYIAGRAETLDDVPDNIRLAVCEYVLGTWRHRRGGSQTFTSNDPDAGGIAVEHGGVTMWRVKQHLAPDLRGPRG